jgi:hypothetical protein
MNCSEILTLVLTLALVLTTAFYAGVTYRILRASERSVQAIRDQSMELTRLTKQSTDYATRFNYSDLIIASRALLEHSKNECVT